MAVDICLFSVTSLIMTMFGRNMWLNCEPNILLCSDWVYSVSLSKNTMGMNCTKHYVIRLIVTTCFDVIH
jgi:hypothetical protein